MTTATKSKRCQHCKSRPASRPCDLCWRCYYTPEIRGKYKTKSVYGARGIGSYCIDTWKGRTLPAEPTRVRAGTAERVAVYEARAAAMVALHHPGDGPLCKPDLN